MHTIEDYNVAFDEIYLFFKQNESFNITALYQAITQNEKLDLTRERLIQFLLNIDDIDIGDSLPDKPLYSYADLVKLNTELKLDTKLMNFELVSEKSISQVFDRSVLSRLMNSSEPSRRIINASQETNG